MELATETSVAFDAKVCPTLLGSAVGEPAFSPFRMFQLGKPRARGHCFVPWAMGGSTPPLKDVKDCPLGKKCG